MIVGPTFVRNYLLYRRLLTFFLSHVAIHVCIALVKLPCHAITYITIASLQ